jgi:hypothetical protein
VACEPKFEVCLSRLEQNPPLFFSRLFIGFTDDVMMVVACRGRGWVVGLPFIASGETVAFFSPTFSVVSLLKHDQV